VAEDRPGDHLHAGVQLVQVHVVATGVEHLQAGGVEPAANRELGSGTTGAAERPEILNGAPAEMSLVLADDALVQTLNRDYRDKQEADLIRELRRPMTPNDPRAVTRANRLLEWFGHTYWRDYYRERIAAQRADDVLVQLLYSQLSPATRKRLFAILGVDKSVAP